MSLKNNERVIARYCTTSKGCKINRSVEISSAKSYGVCSTDCTTNGSAFVLVECLPLWEFDPDIPDLSHTWESLHPMVPSDPSDPVAVYEGLVRAHWDCFPPHEREKERALQRLEESKLKLRKLFDARLTRDKERRQMWESRGVE